MKITQQCILCDSKNIVRLFDSYNTHGRHVIDEKERFPVYRCQDCKIIFLGNISVDQEYYRKYYKLGYYDGQEKPLENGLLARVMNWVSKYSVGRKSKMILKDSSSSSRISILDLGCGSGVFLSQLDNKKFKKSGLEINKEGQEISSNKGIKVYTDEISKVDFGQEKFDAVTMWHVLEHIKDPNTLFSEIAKVLNEKGKLIIQTPNTDCLGFKLGGENWFHLDSPRHLILYNPKAIAVLAKKNGFRVTKIINEFYDYPLDLFWSIREHRLKMILRALYPFLKIYSRENLTYILEKDASFL